MKRKSLFILAGVAILIFQTLSVSICGQDTQTQTNIPSVTQGENDDKLKDFVTAFDSLTSQIINLIESSPNREGVNQALSYLKENESSIKAKWDVIKDLSQKTVTKEAMEQLNNSFTKNTAAVSGLDVKYVAEINNDPDMRKTLLELRSAYFNIFKFGENTSKEKEETEKPKQTPTAFAYKYDELNDLLSQEEMNQRIRLFADHLNTIPYSSGYIILYAGIGKPLKYKTDVTKKFALFSDSNKTSFDGLTDAEQAKIRIRVAFGFRERPTMELYVVPKGADNPKESPTVNLETLRFYDDSTLPKNYVQKTYRELLALALKTAQPDSTDFTDDVASEEKVIVVVEIDEKGNIAKAEIADGPTFGRRFIEEAATQWKFKPAKRNGKPVKVVGVLVFNVKEIE